MTAPRLSVLAVAPYPRSAPSTRFRVAQLIPALASLGVDVHLHPFLSEGDYAVVRRGVSSEALGAVVRGFEGVRSVLATASRYDAVLVQRGIGLLLDGLLLQSLVRTNVPLLYDFDDSVFLPQERGRRWVEMLRAPARTTRDFCRGAEVILAGNEYLAGWARDAVGSENASRVTVLPSAVDTDLYRPGPHRDARRQPTLGWVGTNTTLAYLEALAPALVRLGERIAFRLLVVAGTRRPHLPGVPHEFVPWAPSDETAPFHHMDVGLYPLDDSPWSLGKCGFKAIQYLACGVPCVASPVGVLRDIVTPGETGLHASSMSEWVEACAFLLTDPAARTRMGAVGRARVEAEYSVRRVAPTLAEAVGRAVEAM